MILNVCMRELKAGVCLCVSVSMCKSEAEQTIQILSGKPVSGYNCVVGGLEGRVLSKL